jgi:hypothetical protein
MCVIQNRNEHKNIKERTEQEDVNKDSSEQLNCLSAETEL